MIRAPKIGIIAGGGTAPRELIDFCVQNGQAFHVICLEGQADPTCGDGVSHVWLPLGAVGRLKKEVAAQKIEALVMLGRVRRPSLAEIKPDLLALKVLGRIGLNRSGDDALLTALGKALEAETGARVIGAHEIMGDLLMPLGCLTRVRPDAEAEKDIRRGFDVARGLGLLDVGQAVVVQQGLVLGLEAIEGTDALVARCGLLQRDGARGVLVKAAKPQQDARFDLPTIGPATVDSVVTAGLRGVAIEAGRALLVARDETLAKADAAGVFIVGWEPKP